jgi:hypothetical protein
MNAFEKMTDDEKFEYAHALERKGRELVELLLRKRRLAAELEPLLAPAERAAVLQKLHAGLDARAATVEATALVADVEAVKDDEPGVFTPAEPEQIQPSEDVAIS